MTELTKNEQVPPSNNPLAWLLKHGWEDPSWSRLPVNQIALGMILNDLSDKLADQGLKVQLQEIAQKIIVDNALSVVKVTSP